MDYKNLALLIISAAMVLLVPIMLYGRSFDSVAFNGDFYRKEFLKYGVYNNLPNYDIGSTNNEVLNYLQGGKRSSLIKNNFFNVI